MISEEAFAMAVDCLAGYLFEAKLENQDIPAPSALQTVSLEAVAKELELENYHDPFVNIVTVDVEEYATLATAQMDLQYHLL